MEASAINEPHPDADETDVEDFFSTGEDEAASPDPGTFDPVSGSFPEAEPQASEAPAADLSGPQEQQAKLREIAEREKAASEAAAAEPEADPMDDVPDPTPAEPAGTTGSTTEEPPSEVASEPAKPSGGKKSGSLEREYIVFQQVPLTEKVLLHLLGQIEKGNAPEPRIAYFELHRAEARNVNGAIADAYNANVSALGEKCDLAAVSSKAFAVKHVETKPVTETQLSIS